MKHDWKPAIFAGLVLLGLAACGGGGAGSAPPAGTLQLSTSSSAIALTRGGSTSLPVTLTADAGFSGTVSFVLEKADGSAAPAGLSVTPPDATVSGATTVTLTVVSTTATPTGSHALRLRASGGALSATCGSHCASFSLYVAARGDLDPAFGGGGKVTTAFGTNTDDEAHALALAPDGKIVVAGSSHNGTNYDFALARYNADGSLDSTFGNGGKLTTGIGASHDEAHALALAPDGKIVAAGTSYNGTNTDFALVRYNADGSLDSTFGSGGKVVTPIGAGDDYANDLALAPDGKIVVAGRSYNGTNFDFALARYNADGSLDASFGSGGKVVTPIGSGYDQAFALALAPDGKIVAGGQSYAGSTNMDFALVRYNADGSLDTTFGNGGKVVTAIGSGFDWATGLALAPDGKIVVTGASSNGMNFDFALVRYNADGSLDTTFGNGGKLTTAIGANEDLARAVALAPDGRIVVAGESDTGTNIDFALARYD